MVKKGTEGLHCQVTESSDRGIVTVNAAPLFLY
jgi:hypothetical protein